MLTSSVINVNNSFTSDTMGKGSGNTGGSNCSCTLTENKVKEIVDEYIDPNELTDALKDYVHTITYESKIKDIDYNINSLQSTINRLPTFGTIEILSDRITTLEDKPDYDIVKDLNEEYKTDDIPNTNYEVQTDFTFKNVSVNNKLIMPDGNMLTGLTESYK